MSVAEAYVGDERAEEERVEDRVPDTDVGCTLGHWTLQVAQQFDRVQPQLDDVRQEHHERHQRARGREHHQEAELQHCTQRAQGTRT